MHRSYQPTLPAANRLLQKKWDQKYYSEHQILVGAPSLTTAFRPHPHPQVRDARPTIDTRPPRAYMHLHMKLKKLQVPLGRSHRTLPGIHERVDFSFQLEQERAATIDRDNRILLEKMAHTMRTSGGVDNRNYYSARRSAYACATDEPHRCPYRLASIARSAVVSCYAYRRKTPPWRSASSTASLSSVRTIGPSVGRRTSPIWITYPSMILDGMNRE